MKELLLTYLFVFLTANLMGQQLPTTSHYLTNRFYLNPAFAGIKPCSETNFGHRQQWVGFEGAPLTTFGTFNTRLFKDDKYPDEIHGIGLSLVQDRTGFIERQYVRFAYAYHLKLNKNYRISFGLYAGMQRYSHSYSDIRIPQKSLDPAFDPDEQISLVVPEVSPGIFMYNKSFFLGLSSFQIFPTRMYNIGTNDSRLGAHYYFMAGYRLRGRTLHYIPSFLLNFSAFAPPTMDISLMVDYQRNISFALGSKYLNSAYALVKFRIASTLSVGYVYEYALNEINRVSPTTHEFVVSISSCHQEKETPKFFCPAYQ
ncbi:MAG: PorP/SprF family type IX secretion system membrane protein [Vicingaceae bacterium]